MTVSKVGDLVWVRVQGHPWWPGQVTHFAVCVSLLALCTSGNAGLQSYGSGCIHSSHSECPLCAFVQVMDPKKTTNEKVMKDRKPDHTLISFFGDDSYGWFPKGRDIIPFEKNYAAKSKQPASKKVQHSSLCLLNIAIGCSTVSNM